MSLKRDEDYDEDYDDDLPQAKRPCFSPRQEAEFDDIDPLALDIILGYLDVKSLYRFTFSSKRFSELVTHEHVIRSALISGGHARTTVSEVTEEALKKKTIFPPSPQRLLRLANGKICETAHCSKRVNLIRTNYGLFLCWECLTESTIAIKNSNHMLRNERVARSQYRWKTYVLKEPYMDTAGERAGPIISNTEVSSINSLLEAADASWPNERVEPILQCFDKAVQDRSKLVKQKGEAQSRRRNEKKAKILQLPERLKEMLGECPFKETLCSHQKYSFSNQNEPSIHFCCNFVDNKMSPLVVAPSKATKKNLREIVEYIQETVTMLESSGSLDFSFLEGDKEVNEWESALRALLTQHLTPEIILRKTEETELDQIRNGELFGVVKRWENSYSSGYRRPSTDAPHGDWANVFVGIVMKKYSNRIPPALTQYQANIFARIVYIDVASREEWSDYASLCNHATEKFLTLLPLALEFVDFVRQKARTTSRFDLVMSGFESLRGNVVERFEKREFDSLENDMKGTNEHTGGNRVTSWGA